MLFNYVFLIFFFKQKTAKERRISDWSSDVCSSDLAWFAPKKPIEHYTSPEDTKFWQGVRTNPRRSTAEVRSKFRDIDRRLADIELMYTSRNTRLADEIEQLR